MTAAELIEQLKAFPMDAEVFHESRFWDYALPITEICLREEGIILKYDDLKQWKPQP